MGAVPFCLNRAYWRTPLAAPVPGLALAYPEPIVLAEAGQQLVDRGCTVELANVGGCGELDVRLLVRRDGSAISAELLGPCDGAGPDPDRWYAVRVDPEGPPACIWAGPARSCPTEALVAFVDDLLDDDLQLLMHRYVPIG